MNHPPEPPIAAELSEDVDGCDLPFDKGEQTADEDLPVTFGGEAQ